MKSNKEFWAKIILCSGIWVSASLNSADQERYLVLTPFIVGGMFGISKLTKYKYESWLLLLMMIITFIVMNPKN